jgi:hypothetical protein
MNKEILLGLTRHILTTLGGILVSKGYVDSGSLEMIVGGAVTIAGVLWSVANKRQGQDGPVPIVTINPDTDNTR